MEKTGRETKEKKAKGPERPFGETARWDPEMEKWPPWDGLCLNSTPSSRTIPAVDLYEGKDGLVAKAELPGMEKTDIEVNITDRLLTIKGEKKKEKEVKEKNYYCTERAYGSFVRAIELPKEVAVDRAKAIFKNGLLEVRLPKTKEAQKKDVKVRVE
jgi:HSP20 family protein